jgi:hypothetical protein
VSVDLDDGFRLKGSPSIDAKRREMQASAEARRVGSLAMVEVGCWLYSEKRVQGATDLPLGGCVVEVDERVDRETGEVERIYTVVDFHRDTLHGKPVTVRRLSESEIGQFGVELPTEGHLRRVIAVLAGAVHEALTPPQGARKARILLPEHVDWSRWQHQLAVRAMGGGR